MSSFDALAALQSAGVSIQNANDEQRQVLSTLTADEVAVLASVRERVLAASPETQAHSGPEPEHVGNIFF